LVLFNACDINKWDGFSLTSSGLYYKLHTLGEGEKKAESKNQVFAEITVLNNNKEIVFRNGMAQGAVLKVELGSTSNGSLSEAISLLHSGDSASFIFPNSIDIATISNGKIKEWKDSYVMGIKLNRIVDKNKTNTSIEVQEKDLDELKILRAYLLENDINPTRHIQGVYLKVIKKGNGVKAQSGQNLWINYKGNFLDGKEFDNTKKLGQLLDFQLGKPDQVIRAFEIALHHIDVGGKIQVICSSEFAFGEKGSSTGIVPPYTPVVYEIELVRAI